jgi:hypothetical protein
VEHIKTEDNNNSVTQRAKLGDAKSIDNATVEQGCGRTGAGMRPQNGRKQKWQNHERITKGRQQQGRRSPIVEQQGDGTANW